MAWKTLVTVVGAAYQDKQIEEGSITKKMRSRMSMYTYLHTAVSNAMRGYSLPESQHAFSTALAGALSAGPVV